MRQAPAPGFMTRRLAAIGVLAACLSIAQDGSPAGGRDEPPLAPVLIEAIAHIQRGVSDLRGREFLVPVTVSVMPVDGFKRYVERRLAEEYPPERLAREQIAYVHFGFLEPGDDLGAIFVDLVSGQAAGFYDPEEKRLFLVEGRTFASNALVHEIVHALQDQHFGLRRMLDDARSDDDRLRALQALIEGEASALSSRYLDEHPLTSRQEEALRELAGPAPDASDAPGRLHRFPEMLRKDLMFPYTKGTTWARRLAGRGGPELMDRMFRQPPESTEQILHHEEGRPPDRPSTIEPSCLPDLESDGFRTVKTNTMGEFQLLELLGGEEDPAAADAAAGWDGDLYRIYADPEGITAMVWVTVWDTAGDAEEFSARARDWLDSRRREGAAPDRIAQGGADGRIVGIIQGFDADLAGGLDARLRAACYDAVGLR